jgi:hypothetical protein
MAGTVDTIENIVDMAGEILDHVELGKDLDSEYKKKLDMILTLIKEIHEEVSDESEDEEDDDMNESLAAEAPPYDKTTMKDVLVRRGVLKKVNGKHVVNKAVSYMKKMKEESDPCWDSHEMVGMKMKNGKKVPNCVPKKKK